MLPRTLLLRAAVLAVLTALPASAEDPKWVGVPETHEPTDRDRERLARNSLQNARALRKEGRFEMAEAVTRRGLSARPDDAALLREQALSLDALGQPEEAARARAAADAIAPPPPPPPDTPLALPSRDVLIVLLPPPADTTPARRPRGWPDGPAAAELETRLHVRLPEATVLHAVFDSVEAARRWLPRYRPRAVLSLRVDRVYCAESVKDGRFGMAWLRAAAERPGSDGDGPVWGRVVLSDPQHPSGCEREVLAHAVEQVLAQQSVREALAAPPATGSWSTAAVRTLFPQLGAAIDVELAEGHTLLARGNLAEALERFDAAAAIDPEDPIVRTYRREAEATLVMSKELSRRAGTRADDGALEPRLTAAQLAALETSLVEERRRREELLATLAVLEDDVKLPEPKLLEKLRPVSIPDESAFGPALARRRAGGSITARAAFAPDGSEIARYYFPEGDALPLLREEDASRDGQPDRWIAYRGDARTEIWEDGHHDGRPDVRLVFTAGGQRLLRVELDRDRNGKPERVFHYTRGTLSSEASDSDGDGRLDTFDRLGPDGDLALREEDLDGDGEIDVRSHYSEGKLTRREL